MRFGYHLMGASMLLSLAGCSGVVENGREAPNHGAPSANRPSESAAALIEGAVSARFPPGDSQQCRPLGLPVTDFLTGSFTPQDLAQDEVVSTPDACIHQQVLRASVDSWAAFVYTALCEGGGEARLCGAVATRQCSVETMMKWAESRTTPMHARDHVFAFDYTIPPLDEAARTTLYRRARLEVQTLLDESTEVIRQRTAGTRDCPSEQGQDPGAAYIEGEQTERQIDEVLKGSAVAGSRT